MFFFGNTSEVHFQGSLISSSQHCNYKAQYSPHRQHRGLENGASGADLHFGRGKKQLVIRTIQRWIDCVFAECGGRAGGALQGESRRERGGVGVRAEGLSGVRVRLHGTH